MARLDRIEIAAADGACPACFAVPDGEGPFPGVLLYMDAPGMRPALEEMAARLADAGYAVLLPDIFYRAGAYGPIDPKIVFTDPAKREAHRAAVTASATTDKVMADTAAYLDWLQARAEVAAGPVGVVGYCMGGRLALFAAGTFPERIAAAASYHGGGLASDKPDSPHALAPRMQAEIYVAGATDDTNFPDDMKARLEEALSAAGVTHIVETYPAKHGWVPRDTPAHDPAEAEHHWHTLIPFFDRVLKA